MDFYSLPPDQQEAILETAALEPPDGVDSEFANPPNQNVGAHVLLAFCLAVSSIAVFVRVYVRFFLVKRPFIGDYLLVLAYVIMVADFGMCYVMTNTPGIFVHQWDVTIRDFITFLHFVFISSQVYIFAILPLKVAILLEWLRVFAPLNSRGFVFWSSHVLIWANVCFYLSIVIAFNIACTPYEYNWNILLNGSCSRVDTKDTNLATSVFNLISDVLLLLIPQRAIWSLQMTARKRLGVSVVFCVGFLGCASAVARLVETVQHAESPDFTYTFSSVMLCSAAELTCAFLVMCIPTFPKAFSDIDFAKLKSSLSFWSGKDHLGSKKSSQTNSWQHSGSTNWHGAQEHQDGHYNFPMAKLPPLPPKSADNSTYENLEQTEAGNAAPTNSVTQQAYDPNAANIEYARQQQWH